jgi:hypothetical protein
LSREGNREGSRHFLCFLIDQVNDLASPVHRKPFGHNQWFCYATWLARPWMFTGKFEVHCLVYVLLLKLLVCQDRVAGVYGS